MSAPLVNKILALWGALTPSKRTMTREKGVIVVKRNLSLTILVMLLAIVFVSGCAKKTVLRDEKAAAKESAAAVEVARAAEKAAAVEKSAAALEAARVAEKAASVKKADDAKKSAEAKAAAAASDMKSKEKAAAVPAKDLYELADINFDYDKFSLRDEARGILNKHADWLNRNNDVLLAVEGHCDERGTAEYNLALGERRANAAAKFLIDNGVDAKRIKTISYGEELPLDPGHNEEAWAKNRRAHLVASGKK